MRALLTPLLQRGGLAYLSSPKGGHAPTTLHTENGR